MTREEAISEWTFRSNHIKKWLDEYGEEPSIRHYVELIDMAIEALQSTMSQERVNHESTNDLISRADAIERIANDNVVGGMKRINEYRDSTEHNDYLDGISTAIATVEDIPSADAVGEWKPFDGGKWTGCSNCKGDIPKDKYGIDMYTDYCPNCGARMKGGGE